MRHWWSDQPETVPWTSGTVSLAATAALFAAAFVAMRTVRYTELTLPRSERSQTTVVQLTPPIRQMEPPPAVRRPPPAVRQAPTSVPTTIPEPSAVPAPPVAPTAPVARPIDVAPTVRPEPVRDTSAAAANDAAARRRVFTDLVPLREIPTFPLGGAPGRHPAGRGGAPMAPAGVTAHTGAISTATRDAIATGKMLSIPELAAQYKPTPSETEAIRRQNEPGLPQYGRAARMPGQPASVPLMNGGFAVTAPVASVDFPLFSPGPSPAERKRNEAIDAEYQRRLRGLQHMLQDQLALRRDSIRADSLKQDSLARAARPRP